MNKNQKILYLMKENQKLLQENKRLKEVSTEFQRKEAKQTVDSMIQIYDLLEKEYKKLNYLKFIGMKTKLQYKFMVCILKIRKLINI